jgi:hypothetical protein
MRIAFLAGEKANVELLSHYGWSEEDALSLAATFKKSSLPR